MSRADVVVQVRALRKTFGSGTTRVEALRGVCLEVPRGEFVAIMGPSGSGKSTLLHLVGGLDLADGGTIEVGGKPLADLDDDALTLLRRRSLGFVFQAFNLVPVLTAVENVGLPLRIDGVSDSEADTRAREALSEVGLDGRLAHIPSELSGGEQQRVAIARALATRPVLLLADEPTGNLDTKTGADVMARLRRLCDDRDLTIVMVTHDPRDAACADRLVRMVDGRLVSDRPVAEAERELGSVTPLRDGP